MNILRFEQRYLYEHLYSLFVLPPDSASLESLFELIGAMFQQNMFLAIDDSPFGFGVLSSNRLPHVASRSLDGINSGLPRLALLFSRLLHESPSNKLSPSLPCSRFITVKFAPDASVGSTVQQL
jgi:hypothetical protein